MLLNKDEIIKIFCDDEDFCKEFETMISQKPLQENKEKKTRNSNYFTIR